MSPERNVLRYPFQLGNYSSQRNPQNGRETNMLRLGYSCWFPGAFNIFQLTSLSELFKNLSKLEESFPSLCLHANLASELWQQGSADYFKILLTFNRFLPDFREKDKHKTSTKKEVFQSPIFLFLFHGDTYQCIRAFCQEGKLEIWSHDRSRELFL